MLSWTFRSTFQLTRRGFASSAISNDAKVAVLGAAGGIGQPLSLLLKQSPLVTELSLYDIQNTPGVAADLAHINTHSSVKGYVADNDGLKHALEGCDVVVIPAGVPRKPGMTRDDLFNINASIVRDLAAACAKYCPKAHLLIISNPVNSTVPIVAEVLKKHNVYDARRLFGVTTLDVVRASRFISEKMQKDPKDVQVPVIGGHSGTTIVPLFSQVKGLKLNDEELKALTHRVQFGGDEVVKAKDGKGSATLSMAFAGARFTFSLLEALSGKKNIIEPAFVESPLFAKDGVTFFATNVELGTEGVEKIHEIGEVTAFEQGLIGEAVSQLKGNITKGVKFAQTS
ncbi:Malate dehydrogenase, cytoplasmic [Entomophthora muscae]|uniref:Malate dehydrogenase, cytoplasmic n=1 Tax=Entomophthora muscae TaxID=34485 RepID=A0ACC2T0D7_9FUNG|nr:Malate dehydrogenase, cytoplasmic [Entomophthora muscae]